MSQPLNLIRDNRGFVVSIELIFLASIAVIGLVVGLTSVRDAVVSELSDTAGSVQDLNQSFNYNGAAGLSANTAGSDFEDALDFGDDAGDASGDADNCITFDRPPQIENVGGAGGL